LALVTNIRRGVAARPDPFGHPGVVRDASKLCTAQAQAYRLGLAVRLAGGLRLPLHPPGIEGPTQAGRVADVPASVLAALIMPRLARGRQPRSKTVGFGVTDAEIADLHTRAALAGYATLGAWIRDAVFGVQVAQPPAQIDQDTNTQLRGIGGNLNQALKRINSGHGVEADWELIREASRAVILMRGKLIGQDPGEPLTDRIAGVPNRLQVVSPAKAPPAVKPGTWTV